MKILITGASKGIGLAITKLLLKDNHELVVISRDFSQFDIQSEKIKKIEFDLTNVSEIIKLVNQTGPIDILINNAGMMNSLSYDKYPEDKKRALIALNVEAPVELITRYVPAMIEKGKGRVISIASIAGEIGHPDIWYGITKAGVINYTKSFAKLLGSKGIQINCVAPGPVEGTPMFTVIPEERKKQLLNSTVSSRFATPEEIAKTVYWLAMDAPDYINGICIDVNNGAFLR